MTDRQPTTPAEQDPRKVRLGLALITVMFLVAVVMIFVVEGPAMKALFFALAGVTVLRAALLARWLRRQGQATPPAA